MIGALSVTLTGAGDNRAQLIDRCISKKSSEFTPCFSVPPSVPSVVNKEFDAIPRKLVCTSIHGSMLEVAQELRWVVEEGAGDGHMFECFIIYWLDRLAIEAQDRRAGVGHQDW